MKYSVLIGLVTAAVMVGCSGEERPRQQPAAPTPPAIDVVIDGGPKPPKEHEADFPFLHAGFVAGDRVLWTDAGVYIAQLDAITGKGLRRIAPQVAHPGSVLFLPDGQHAVTVGPQVVCWDLDTGKVRWSFADQPQARHAFCGAISPDGCWGVHANQDGTLRLWDVAKGHVRTLGGHAGAVGWVTFSPDSQWLLSGAGDATIKLWNVPLGVFRRTVDAEVCGAGAFSPDGKYALTTVREPDTAALWEVASGKEVRRLKLAPLEIRHLVFLPDGKRVLAVGDDRVVRTWDVKTGKLLRECYWKEGGGAESVVVSADGKRALLMGNQTLALWDLENNEEVRTLANQFAGRVHGVGEVKWVTFSPDGRQVFGKVHGRRGPGLKWNALVTWDAESGRVLRTTEVDAGVFLTIWSADGTRALACENGFVAQLTLWDVTSGRLVRTLEKVEGHVYCLDFSPDGRFALGSYVNRTLPTERALLLWDLETGKLIETFARELSEEQFQCVHFSAHGRRIVAGTSRWRVWDIATGKLLHDWPGPQSLGIVIRPYHAVFSGDSKRALTYGEKLQLWNLTTGALLRTLPIDTSASPVTAAAFSADGKWALSAGGTAGAIQVWDLSSGQAVRTFVGRGVPGRVDSLAFSPDGKRAVADGEWMAQIWDVTRGRDIRNFVLHKVP
jgi:WD40 repeat protein